MGSKQAFATRGQLEAIALEHPTPFYLYDEAMLRKRAELLSQAFSWNPGYREHFAVKATPNPAIIGILREYGFGVDCSSECELQLAEAMGFCGDEVMFTSNDTPSGEFAHAHALGATITLDDVSHVDQLVAECSPVPSRVSLRVNPGGDFVFQNGIFGSPEESKFGLTVPQVFEAVRRLGQLGVHEFGLHALLASNTLTNDYLPALARTLFGLAVLLRDELGARIALVNLSGGVGVDYRPEDAPNDILAIGEGVRTAYEELLVPAGMGDVAIATELGRWLTGPCGVLVTRVIHMKHAHRDVVGVDACSSNLMRPMLYGAYHHISVAGREDEPATCGYDVAGMLCENGDRFATGRMLPPVQVGDLLCIHDAGAHGHAMGFTYNGRLRSAELLLCEDGSVRLIRRAETPADYFSTLDVLPEGQTLLKRAQAGADGMKPARP